MVNSITHYYHFSAELCFGLWRTYSALDPFIPPSGKTNLPPPRRILFTHLNAGHWRDYASLYLRTQRTASEPFALPGSPNWWSTFRDLVIQPTGLNASTGAGTMGNPVITYISRQDWGRRMLIQSDHEKLVEELYKLRDQYGYEVNVESMDKLSRVEQLELAGRTTVCASCLS